MISMDAGPLNWQVGDKTELIWRGVPITVKDLEGREYRISHLYRRSFGDISGSGQ